MDPFASSVTNKKYKIKHCFNCNEKCLIYLFTCKLRWNNYESNNRKYQHLESCMKEHLFELFNDEGHHGFLEDVSTTFIDKTDSSDP